MKNRKFSFKGKVGKADEKFKGGSNYGYLMLPEGVGVFSPELETSVTFDIMPYVVSDPNHPERDNEEGIAQVGDLWWRRPFTIHRNIGSGNDKNSVVCLQSFGKKCPICEYRAKLLKEGKLDDENKEALKTSPRVLYCIIPLNAKKDGKPIPKTPHIFDISFAMFGKKLKKEMDDENVSEICMDLAEGTSLKVRFDEKTMGGKNAKPFAEAGRIDSKNRETPYKESILEKIPDLDKVLKQLTYAEMEAKFFDLEGEEDDEAPKKKKGKATKAVKEEEDDDEEDEAPKKKKSAKPAPVEEEEDDDDEDEDDEEDDDDEEEEEEEDEQPSTQDLINEAKNIADLLAIAREYPGTFKSHLKSLKTIAKVSALKKAMLAICDEAEDEDDADEDDLPFKKGVKGSSSTKTEQTATRKKKKAFTWEEISQMRHVQLIDLCENSDLTDVDPDDYDDDIKAFRRAIAKSMDIEIPKIVPQPAPIKEKDKCPVCKGSGKNKKGGACATCAGTGVKQADAEDDDDEEEEDVPVKKSKKSSGDKCPNGYKFGVDTDKKDECEDCDLWDACMAQKKKNK